MAVFNIIAIIAQKIIIMEQNNTDIINLPKGSYVTLPKDEYMELQALKNKDYDFEKRLSDIKKDYEEKYDKFEKSKSVLLETHYESQGYFFCGRTETRTLKVDGLKKELLEWLKKSFGIESIKYTRDGIHISLLGDIKVVEDLTEEYKEKIKNSDGRIRIMEDTINILEVRNKILERYVKSIRGKSIFYKIFHM